MSKKLFLATSALILCVSSSFAGRDGRGVAADKLDVVDRNAQFLSWYGTPAPGNASTLLYEQSASSGFSTYAVPSWRNDSAHDFYGSSSLAADDFIIPGKGTHTITSVYAAGTGDYLNSVDVIFFDKLEYNKKTGVTTAIVKATCDYMPFTDSNGDLTVDVSSCNAGKFKAGHDYAVSVQGLSPGPPVWAWQTNRKQIGRQAFWYGHGNASCDQQLTPVKICFKGKGYGRDLAFAIYGN